ncbi:MAG: hypothetical protein Q4G61_11235 [Tissierellia bacterium]|nr:hypothetical protein [Tissierellia bacterium]
MMNEMKHGERCMADSTEVATDIGDSYVDDTKVEVKTLVPCTVRFSREADSVFRTLADEYNVSKAEIIRLAASGGLAKYLGNLKYIDRKQAVAINQNISELANANYAIAEQLRRIGVNYNQQIKLRNIQRKRDELKARTGYDLNSISAKMSHEKKLDEEEQDILNDATLLDRDTLLSLMNQFEEASRKVSEILWRIRE